MDESTALKAGIARQIISPPEGIFLIGYGDRSKGNVGVHDDLTATALVLEDGEKRLGIVALDMLAINETIVDRVREGLPGIEVLLCCSHTHSGPIAYADRRSGRSNRRFIDGLVEKISQAVREAAQRSVPARATWSQGEADIAINRRELQPDGRMEIGRNPAGVVDRSLQVVSLFTLEGRRMATLVNYACHGTVLGPDNLLVSADWIGAMRRKVEEKLGGLALYLQGAAGNLNPDMDWEAATGFQTAQKEGEQVAEQVLAAVDRETEPISLTPLGISRSEVWLPLEVLALTPKPPKEAYRAPMLKMGGKPTWMGFLVDRLLNTRYPWRSRIEARDGMWSVPMRANAVRLGAMRLVTFAAEVFTEIGLQVKAQSTGQHTLFASLTDGCIGYLTTASAHDEGGYEVEVAPFAYRYPRRLSAQGEALALEEVQKMQATIDSN